MKKLSSIFLKYHQEEDMVIPYFDLKNNDHRFLLLFVFTIAIIFNILSKSETSTVLTIILLTIGIWIYLTQIYPKNIEGKNTFNDEIDAIVKERVDKNERDVTGTTSYYVKSFPIKGFTYLKENDKMMSIAKNLLFLRVFDKGRFEDMILMMDRLQKIYIYILIGRYDCKQGMNIFMDIRDILLKTLYSFYIVLPMKTKHMYGVDPHKELDKSIKNATYLTRQMITILENYARRECNTPYLDPTLPTACDPMNSPNTVP